MNQQSTPAQRDDAAPEVLWQPSVEAAAASRMARYQTWLSGAHGVRTDGYEDLWRWSVEEPEQFWVTLWEFFGVTASASFDRVLSSTGMPGARWFEGARLNHAEQVFAAASTERPALVLLAEDESARELSWADLRRQVAALAANLRSWGVRPGDRVAGYLPNTEHAVVSLLATASLGAVWACCPPDYGSDAAADRLRQIEPTVFIGCDGYRFGGRHYDRSAELAAVVETLPTVREVVLVGRSDRAPQAGWHAWEDAVGGDDVPLVFEQVPFDHPLWILYSSGTTGLPKGIVHSHGGIVVEHLKWLGLHNDVQAGDRFFWYTSTAWMIWYVLVDALMLGATVVLYDGSPAYPEPQSLWDTVAEQRVTFFGTSAGHLVASSKAGLRPRDSHDLSALRCIMSTGSPLPPAGWRWVYDAVKPDVWLDSPSGGTDVCTPYVGGCPLKPVVVAESQCRFLGTRVESWDDDGHPVPDGATGELVVTAPMPSMPLYFWNDPDGERYRSAYFDHFPGVWRHGDWISITDRGSAVIQGRSDSTLNRRGVRMGSAEIYAVVDAMPEVADSLVIGAELEDGQYWMPLFVVLSPGVELDEDLRTRISQRIRSACTARHVPDEILEVPAVPHTLTGKRLEVPVKRLIQGAEIDDVVKVGVIDRPDVLPVFVEIGRRARAARRVEVRS
ncbi:MAG: acetoacetyl-CoA synthase [Frankiales bacterium]|nr:acetoacetyl-CoA synthase [Frankiales bacterium]